MLVARGADPHVAGCVLPGAECRRGAVDRGCATPLAVAAARRNAAVCEYLIAECGADVRWTAASHSDGAELVSCDAECGMAAGLAALATRDSVFFACPQPALPQHGALHDRLVRDRLATRAAVATADVLLAHGAGVAGLYCGRGGVDRVPGDGTNAELDALLTRRARDRDRSCRRAEPAAAAHPTRVATAAVCALWRAARQHNLEACRHLTSLGVSQRWRAPATGHTPLEEAWHAKHKGAGPAATSVLLVDLAECLAPPEALAVGCAPGSEQDADRDWACAMREAQLRHLSRVLELGQPEEPPRVLTQLVLEYAASREIGGGGGVRIFDDDDDGALQATATLHRQCLEHARFTGWRSEVCDVDLPEPVRQQRQRAGLPPWLSIAELTKRVSWREGAYCALMDRLSPPARGATRFAHWRTRHIGLTPLCALPAPFVMASTPGNGRGFRLAELPFDLARARYKATRPMKILGTLSATLSGVVDAVRENPAAFDWGAEVEDAFFWGGKQTLPLVFACLYAPVEVCRELLAAAPDEAVRLGDALDYSPLHAAAARGSVEVCRILVARGADVHALSRSEPRWPGGREDEVSEPETGVTPLALAASHQRAAVCEFLIAECGADVRWYCKDRNDVITWVVRGNVDGFPSTLESHLRSMIGGGFPQGRPGLVPFTPYVRATLATIDVLVAHGADPAPALVVRTDPHGDLAELLLHAGAGADGVILHHYSPLQWEARTANLRGCRGWVGHGANLARTGGKSRTPIRAFLGQAHRDNERSNWTAFEMIEVLAPPQWLVPGDTVAEGYSFSDYLCARKVRVEHMKRVLPGWPPELVNLVHIFC